MKKIRKVSGSCAPLALKYLSGLCDHEVHDICVAHGFIQEHGMEEHEFLGAAKDMGIRLRRMNLKKLGLYRSHLGRFIRENMEGKFLIYTSQHLFVVSGGQVIDPLHPDNPGLRRIVTGVWRAVI